MKINANDQLDLKGACINGCDLNNLSFYNYSLYMLTSKKWIPFTNTSYYYTTGLSPQKDLTVKEDLFIDYSLQIIWKIELDVFVPSKNTSGSTSIVFYINFPPRSGSCTINPQNGTTDTLFSISCINWIDLDGILDSYSFYGI